MNKCDVCDSTNGVLAGRWIFYCPEHKQVDIDKTLENELRGDDSDFDYLNNNPEVAELLI